MKIIWELFVLVAACVNTYWVAAAWHTGAQPDWFVWTSSILFSIGVALDCLKNLAGEA